MKHTQTIALFCIVVSCCSLVMCANARLRAIDHWSSSNKTVHEFVAKYCHIEQQSHAIVKSIPSKIDRANLTRLFYDWVTVYYGPKFSECFYASVK